MGMALKCSRPSINLAISAGSEMLRIIQVSWCLSMERELFQLVFSLTMGSAQKAVPQLPMPLLIAPRQYTTVHAQIYS